MNNVTPNVDGELLAFFFTFLVSTAAFIFEGGKIREKISNIDKRLTRVENRLENLLCDEKKKREN